MKTIPKQIKPWEDYQKLVSKLYNYVIDKVAWHIDDYRQDMWMVYNKAKAGFDIRRNSKPNAFTNYFVMTARRAIWQKNQKTVYLTKLGTKSQYNLETYVHDDRENNPIDNTFQPPKSLDENLLWEFLWKVENELTNDYKQLIMLYYNIENNWKNYVKPEKLITTHISNVTRKLKQLVRRKGYRL